MAAAYAAVVPLLEVPSGILADRWSRRWVMVLAIGVVDQLTGRRLSNNVISYVVAAMILGIYFALSSGTVDSVVYDTVLEETGSSELYEKWIGRVRAVEAAALVISALAGGVLAEYTSARFTYFATLPLVGLAIIGFVWFDEPQLHKGAERVAGQPYRRHVSHHDARAGGAARPAAGGHGCTAVAGGVRVRSALAGCAGGSAVAYGPYWAALVSTIGLGGLIVGKLNLDRRWMVAIVVALPLAAALVLTWTRSLVVVIAAQIVLALLLAIIGIHAGKLLHDAVPSAIRAVSSGAGTLSWMLFLPFSLTFGWVAQANGVNWSGWMLAGAVVVVGVLLIVSIRAAHRDAAAQAEEAVRAEEVAAEGRSARPARRRSWRAGSWSSW